MRIESKLCHLTESKAIVQVTGWNNEKNIGSALAEGSTVEDAEDKAIFRLKKRINMASDGTTRNLICEDKAKTPLNVESPKSKKINIINEPSDWSDELTAIDSEIERLKWTRDDEINFLEEKLGYNNRNKITKYSDIVRYLSLLKEVDIPCKSEKVNESVNNLILESDMLLRDLSWDNNQGRKFLKKEFNVSTRKELNEDQLILFIAKLKAIRNQYLAS